MVGHSGEKKKNPFSEKTYRSKAQKSFGLLGGGYPSFEKATGTDKR